MPAAAVAALLQKHPTQIWRAREQGSGTAHQPTGLSTGHAALDACLPGRGWPRQGLIEILCDGTGLGELQLLLPALCRLCRPGERGGWITWVSPPHRPYAPALVASGLDLARNLFVQAPGATEWAMDQALRSEACSAVLGWSTTSDSTALRRLQLAAEQSRSLAVLFRPVRAGLAPTPAMLRLALLGVTEAGLQVRIVKSRGGRPATLTLGR
jgi:hypothetical protein